MKITPNIAIKGNQKQGKTKQIMSKSNLIECPNCGCELHIETKKPEITLDKHQKPELDDLFEEKLNYMASPESKETKGGFERRKEELQEVVNNLEKGILDICQDAASKHMPWHYGIPPAMNRYSGQMYSGENIWLLWRKCKEKNYSQNKWATFYQWSALGAKVKKGEKSTFIKIYIPRLNTGQLELEDKSVDHEEQDANGFFVKYFRIFNADQVKGWYEDTEQTSLWEGPNANPFVSLDKMIEELGVRIIYGSDRAEYRTGEDVIRMPYKASFTDTPQRKGIDAYYSVLLQELIQWTGHFSRCNRIGRNNLIGESGLAFEKMIAELGGAMLSSYFHNHVEVRMENTRYMDSWKKIINHDIRYLYHAQNQALSALTWIFEKTSVLPFDIKEKPFYPMTEKQVKDLEMILQ